MNHQAAANAHRVFEMRGCSLFLINHLQRREGGKLR